MTNLTILATGPDLLGDGVRGTEPVVCEMIRGASREIHMMAYSISAGGMHIVDLLEEALDRGVRVVLVVNRIHEMDGPAANTLLDLNRRHGHFILGSFTDPDGGDLHAKVLVADREAAVIGSANVSRRGMAGNIEIGVLIRDGSCWKLADMTDGLAGRFAVPKRPGGTGAPDRGRARVD